MSSVTLVFPHQLFEDHPAIRKDRQVYLIEEELFFNQYKFHTKKLLFHRASMRYYADWLKKKEIEVNYIEASSDLSKVTELIKKLHDTDISEIHYVEVVDDWLEKRIRQSADTNEIITRKYRSPCFLNSKDEASAFFENRSIYFQTDFYIDQRKKRNLLLEADGKPIGGKWTYDAENRLRFPKGEIIPAFTLPNNEKYLPEAIDYVEKHYPNNYGNTEPPFFKNKGFFPVTHREAKDWLDDFLQNRFQHFGVYEDAMVAKEGLLYHSAWTPMLNTGLLTPQQVLTTTLDAAIEYDIPLNSLEGFVRQVIGWREFIRIVYEREGVKQRTKNFWGFTRKIPKSFWTGDTGIEPVDIVIKKVLQSSYSHHIERLMVMGNFMLLCEFDPDEVYRWFMEMYIDAYDWVMVPNVYGMTQFADGGLMTTKPYISGSNYLMKMGDWKKGPWQQTWDGLFWRFMKVHEDFFSQNPRLGLLLKTFEKMPVAKQQKHIKTADNFLSNLDR
jgi:deoxyribodipyrimidine photolyase-related protein